MILEVDILETVNEDGDDDETASVDKELVQLPLLQETGQESTRDAQMGTCKRAQLLIPPVRP